MDIWIDCYPYNAFSTSIGATTYDEGFLQRYGNDVSKIEMTDGEFKGRRIPDLETFHRLRREHPEYLTVGHVMDSAEVERALLHPRTMVGSDGILLNGAGHPRAAGSFPRFLRMYALERNLLSMPEAVSKVTCMAAKRFGLNKGTLSVGADADVTVFDPKTLTDNATFQEPGLAPTGIQLVLLNGMPVLENGEILCADQGYMITR
jgi:N-acyl-D-amino-acid deacylase